MKDERKEVKMRRSEDEWTLFIDPFACAIAYSNFFVSFFCFEKMLRGKGKQPSIMCPEADVNDTMLQG